MNRNLSGTNTFPVSFLPSKFGESKFAVCRELIRNETRILNLQRLKAEDRHRNKSLLWKMALPDFEYETLIPSLEF